MERIRSFSQDNQDQDKGRGPSVNPSPQIPPPRPTPVDHAAAHVNQPSLASKILVILLIVASIVFIANMTLQLVGKRGSTPVSLGSARVDTDSYQAVFLTNGQVYFGKLSDINSEYLQLSDVYYLQITQSQENQELQEGGNDANTDPQITLAKLGSELHGPQDSMYISRDQVLFWENLRDKDNSRVIEAIENYKTEQNDNPDDEN